MGIKTARIKWGIGENVPGRCIGDVCGKAWDPLGPVDVGWKRGADTKGRKIGECRIVKIRVQD